MGCVGPSSFFRAQLAALAAAAATREEHGRRSGTEADTSEDGKAESTARVLGLGQAWSRISGTLAAEGGGTAFGSASELLPSPCAGPVGRATVQLEALTRLIGRLA